MITVWGRRSSSNVQAVLWCLAELEVPYRRIDAGFTYGVVDTADYLAMNPNGKVPTIRDGTAPPLFESGAILRYLASRYARDDAFWPAAPERRAQVDQWAEWAKVNVAAAFTVPVFWQAVRVPEARRDPRAIAAAVRRLDALLAIAETRLAAAPFLAGEAFTLADIQLGHLLHRYFDLQIERAELPCLRRYHARLAGRAAYREHVMVSYAELVDSM